MIVKELSYHCDFVVVTEWLSVSLLVYIFLPSFECYSKCAGMISLFAVVDEIPTERGHFGRNPRKRLFQRRRYNFIHSQRVHEIHGGIQRHASKENRTTHRVRIYNICCQLSLISKMTWRHMDGWYHLRNESDTYLFVYRFWKCNSRYCLFSYNEAVNKLTQAKPAKKKQAEAAMVAGRNARLPKYIVMWITRL